MKKLFLFVIILIIVPSFAFCFVFPHHVGVDVGLSERSDNSVTINVGLSLNPYFFDCLNPSLFVTSNINLFLNNPTSFTLTGGVRVDLAYITKHPLTFMTANVAALTPSLSAAVRTDFKTYSLELEASLIRLMEKDAIYEYLVPSILMNLETKGVESYSVCIFRFTGLF